MSAGLILVGGGLANSLIAHRLLQIQPQLSLRVLEAESRLGGNHTWSFHEADVPAEQLQWLEPLVEHRWAGYSVAFPGRRRRLAGGYCSLTGEHLHRVVAPRLGDRLALDTAVDRVEPHRVVLASGEVLSADAVIDGRGSPQLAGMAVCYQKFVGQHVELDAPHGLAEPVLMDATVSQHDGYRFVYLLPFGAAELLVEDTYYSESAALDAARCRQRIADYAASRGWRIARVSREERGVLPIVLDGDIEAFWAAVPRGQPRAGMRAALFHPTTGYSLPEAVGLADAIARERRLDSATLAALVRARSRRRWREQAFFRMLNRMLFLAAAPGERYRVLEHFYRLPVDLIERFYAGQLRPADRLRILSGRPPVPVGRALRAAWSGPARCVPTAIAGGGS